MAREFKAKSGDEEEEISDFREPDVRRIVDDAQFRLGMIVKIIIIFFLISVVIVGVLLTRNKVVREKISSMTSKLVSSVSEKHPIKAVYSWKKKPNQYGYNPEQRFGGPFDAKITRNNDRNFSFVVYTRMGECYFDGWKIEGTKKIEGRWRCPKTGDGGKWELQEDTRRPGMYTGIETDSYLPEGKPSELIIID